jgi:hypothetical protein
VHVHNLHNLGAALLDEIAVRGLPSYFSTHNYWLICPRNYLYTEQLDLCHGPADRGAACATCVGSPDRRGYQERLAEVRTRFRRGIDTCLAVSEAMKRTLVTNGYPEEMIDVVRQAMPEEEAIWQRLGADRAPGRSGETLTVGFFGSAYPHKGPNLLIEAAQRCDAEIRSRDPRRRTAPVRRAPARARPPRRRHRRRRVRPRQPRRPAGRRGRGCDPVAVVGLRAADGGRVPGRSGSGARRARMGGIPDFIRDGQDGLLFDGRDVDDLAASSTGWRASRACWSSCRLGLPAARFSEYVDELGATTTASGRPATAPTPGR